MALLKQGPSSYFMYQLFSEPAWFLQVYNEAVLSKVTS